MAKGWLREVQFSAHATTAEDGRQRKAQWRPSSLHRNALGRSRGAVRPSRFRVCKLPTSRRNRPRIWQIAGMVLCPKLNPCLNPG